MMINTHNHGDYSEKMQGCQDYIHALQEEHKKIQVFRRELPLCLELVTQAIEACKQQLSDGQSECSEQISSEGPILEEFIPVKRVSSNSDNDEEQSKKPSDKNSKNNNEKFSKKSDWLRSVGLWNQTPDPNPKEDLPKKDSSGAFHPFKKEGKSIGTGSTTAQEVMNRSVAVAEAAAEKRGGGGGGNKKERQGERKSRRTWSAELHKRFLQALEQLGGSHVATPKQIREFMKVDGLTNDEVKSHLQKYRLHTRRSPNHPIHNNNNQQPSQFVVVGGIWVPPPEHAAMATTTALGEASGVSATSNRIYAPIAKLPPPFSRTSTPPKQKQQHKQVHYNDLGGHSEEGDVQSHSPIASSSIGTTNTSLTH
ncbi:transcription factor HHO3-like [Olea europaea subsp. europaea]|uniref:Transcription factor HHO3-like n=1 Tax=Olea europaea subsp. europaea TaxID=158383 RepID=A0A8S0TC44_OLEEU|nr:transcription factor HHO3-like [Olea europaea subsp. europaea]